MTILAHRSTDRICDIHHATIVELLIRGTTLQNDWVIAVCEDCYQASSNANMKADLPTSDPSAYTATTTDEGS